MIIWTVLHSVSFLRRGVNLAAQAFLEARCLCDLRIEIGPERGKRVEVSDFFGLLL